MSSMYAESLRAFLKPVVAFLDDDKVSEVLINGPEDIWIERAGKLERTDAKFSVEGLIGAARNLAQSVGRPLSEDRPRLDARMPDGSRIHAVIAPVVKVGAIIAIRKFFKDKMAMDGLVARHALTAPMARFVEAAVVSKLNLIVAGGTSSGKTTLLNVTAAYVPSHERIIVLEDSSELQMNQPHVVPMEARPPDKNGKNEVGIGDLLHSALRLRPDRIVVGEVRGAEAFHLVQAMNTGHGGSMATTHANTPMDTLRRIESLCLMGPQDMPLVAVRAQVASAIQMVMTCGRMADGSRRITAISEVLPLNERGDYRTQDIFLYHVVGRAEDGTVLGFHGPTGAVPHMAHHALAMGFSDLTDDFFDPATYGLPAPPEELVSTGEIHTRWAPSLKFRERGDKDPAAIGQGWSDHVRKLSDAHGAPAGAPAPPTSAPKPIPPIPAATVTTSSAFYKTTHPPAVEPISRSALTARPPASGPHVKPPSSGPNTASRAPLPPPVLENNPRHASMRAAPRVVIGQPPMERGEDTDAGSFERTVIRPPDDE